MKELSQMLSMDVLKVVKWTDVPKTTKTIYSSMFLKAKYKPDGTFEKLKARLVAGGDMVEVNEDEDVSSPTLDLTSFYIMLMMASTQGHKIGTTDIPSAYLWASRSNRKTIYMRLAKEVANAMVTLKPEYLSYLNDKGELLTELKQALYGIPDSGELWHSTFVEFTKSLGFKQHPMDDCVFKHESRDLSICLYVDDLLISAKDDADFTWMSSALNTRFKDVVINTGPNVDYLGMKIQFKDGYVDLSMPKHVTDIVTSNGITKSSKLPHTANLFQVDPNSEVLCLSEKDGFRSIIASLLYVAKRVRPDILLPVQFLSTRVSKPTQQDKHKLLKILQYLHGTKDLSLQIGADPSLQVHAYVDASYACHENGKGQTGVVITLGNGPIFVKSTKQKIVTKSSTEAEIIGVSDALSQIIWIRDFIKHFSHHNLPAIIYQDNTSALSIMMKGKATGPHTKHINVRYSFIKDRIDQGEVIFQHLPTDQMVADLLTKPLPYSQYTHLRMCLLSLSNNFANFVSLHNLPTNRTLYKLGSMLDNITWDKSILDKPVATHLLDFRCGRILQNCASSRWKDVHNREAESALARARPCSDLKNDFSKNAKKRH